MISSIVIYLLLLNGFAVCVCYDVVGIPDEDVRYLNERLQMKEYMSAEDALNTIAELENFYTAIKIGIKGEPSEMIDKAWHAHILNTPMYFKFSEMVFGKYLHHLPFWSGNMVSVDATLVPSARSIYKRLEQLGIQSINETVWTFRYPQTTSTDDECKNEVVSEEVVDM
jgi:hypothetical protein